MRSSKRQILSLNNYLIDNGKNADARKKRQNMIVVLNMRDFHMKLKDIYYMGKLYNFYSHYPNGTNRKKIFDYCFQGDPMTKTKREQFYRFIELWNA